jgi:hypothetical protein
MRARCPAPERVNVHATMAHVLTHPWLVFVTGWNWKTAVLSAICRAALWPAAIVGHAKEFSADSLRGFWIEFVFRLAIGGFWGSLLQAFCAARPAWLAGLYLGVLLPAIALCLEFLALQAGGARHAGTITVTSIAFSLISLLVNWGLMRKGMLLTGRGTPSLVTDLRRVFAALVGLGSAASATQESSGGSSA